MLSVAKFFSLALVLLNLQFILCEWPQFRLFTRNNRENFHLTTSSNILNSPFRSTRKSFFIIHGFNGNPTNDWALQIKDALLTKADSNVFIVDWAEGAAGLDYSNAANNVRESAKEVARFIKDGGIKTSDIHCIGHSLGAHQCGFIGKSAKLGRISGLDPAGPLFKGSSASARLDKSDADFVDVIHVDAILGIQDQIGHKDFYPNGGASQPGCFFIGKRSLEYLYADPTDKDIVDLLGCSHLRVTYLYADTINSACPFTSIKCNNYDDYKNGKCSCSTMYGCSSMGYSSIMNKEEGKFYLATNSKQPFCKN